MPADAPDETPSVRQRMLLTLRLLREHDRLAVPLVLLAFLIPVFTLVLVGVFTHDDIVLPVLGVLVGVMAALVMFNVRSREVMFGQLEGRPGAALQVLQNSVSRRGGGLAGTWYLSPAVQLNQRQDLVHRLVSRCGVVLVAEGQSRAVRDLLVNEARRVRRVAGDTAVHDFIVGSGPGELALDKLVAKLNRLPRTLGKDQAAALHHKLEALPAANIPIPKGPMPTRMPRGRNR